MNKEILQREIDALEMEKKRAQDTLTHLQGQVKSMNRWIEAVDDKIKQVQTAMKEAANSE